MEAQRRLQKYLHVRMWERSEWLHDAGKFT